MEPPRAARSLRETVDDGRSVASAESVADPGGWRGDHGEHILDDSLAVISVIEGMQQEAPEPRQVEEIGGSRVVRGAVIGGKENAYFQAAEAIGGTRWRTLIHHVLPSIAAPVFGDAVRDLLDPRLRGGGGRLGAVRGTSR